MIAKLGGSDDRFTYVEELAIPPHLFGGPTPSYARSEALNQLLAIHRLPRHPIWANEESTRCAK
jgi:hypothetical protein